MHKSHRRTTDVARELFDRHVDGQLVIETGGAQVLQCAIPDDEADAIAAREEGARHVNAPYAIDAVREETGGVRPAHIKDRIRALGPTVRPDLTLKPADPEAGNWVI